MSLGREDYLHIPACGRITGSVKYSGTDLLRMPKDHGNSSGTEELHSAGRKKGKPNKGCGVHNYIEVRKAGEIVCVNEAKLAAKAAHVGYKTVLDYAKNHKETKHGYTFKRVPLTTPLFP